MKVDPGPAIHHILVLCEGNHCRGPMAEALLRSLLPPGFQVESAGLEALEGRPADVEAQRLMAAQGLDISSHRGRQLTEEMALKADLILVMDRPQKEWCERVMPSALGRIFLLGHWLPAPRREISDPYGMGTAAFNVAFEGIRESVADWLPRLTHR
ncbi:MAG TPA: low molecular weight protein-tyrosine-phosphatase [Holophagaceae bacterium]|jgi:protein-tyrosine phosphatase|nr:low molecular weight protein-tyrosine-phosphatase [Holophagaceae bacterium]